MDQIENKEFLTDELLGPLNEVEQRFAPKHVYASGNPAILNQGARVSIVGTRKPSPEGVARARKLARLLVAQNAVVVSGLAAGIDAAAHRAAIEARGKTVAVIGTPLDRCYPAENAELQRTIMREHLCISQFPSGYPMQPRNFPLRNRTMALFSDATVIIEAGSKSGTLHQGWEALRLGRGLFIAHSLIQNTSLGWPQELVKYGACDLSDETLGSFFSELPQRDPAWAENVVSF